MALRGLLPLLTARPEFRRLLERAAPESNAPTLTGIAEAARPFLVAALASGRQRPVLYVVRDAEQVPQATETLRALLDGTATVLPYLESDALPYERLVPEVAHLQTRMAALTALSQGESASVVVASARALTQPLPPPAEFLAALVPLEQGTRFEPRALLQRLLALGYEPVPEVEEPGQVSHRGGIVDCFPPALERPVRIEFWGDEVESLRTFDPVTQRSLNPLERCVLGPAREALALHGPQAAERLEHLSIVGMNPDARARWQRQIEALRARQSFEEIAAFLTYLHPPTSLLAYLPVGSLVVLHDAAAVRHVAEELAEQGEEVRDRLERDGENPPGLLPAFLPWPELAPVLAARPQVRFAALAADAAAEADAHDFALAPDLAPATAYGGRLRAFAQEVRKLLRERQRVVVVSLQARRLAEVFADESLLGHKNVVHVSPLTTLPEPPEVGTLSLVHGRFPEGWHSRSLALTVFSDTEVFGWSKRRTEQRRHATPAAFLAELRPGDYVVHQDHGIGRFDGLIKLTQDGVDREYLLIGYAGSDRLYIPTDQLDRITRYVGMGESVPALSKLGGADWARAKQRARESAREIAGDLLRLYSLREVAVGHPFPPDEEQPWLLELEEGFPYEETPDQEQAIRDVKADMERARPMDRLVCGDVGYGKTEVALRAAFKAVLDQRQVAVLVPTTVLALQHFNTFSERLKPYPVRVELLNRFRSEREQKEVLADLAAGKVDIVIGTHRLLQKDVSFARLGLLVIDEEQRFGVAHKERLKQLRTEVDVLTLTATPIPRTLYMSLANVRDMSVIETPPQDRLPIRTFVREFDDALIREVILREVDRGGQVFFVHNRVKGILSLRDRLRKLVPEATFGVAHGQMPEDALEQVMLDFASGQCNVLVCTTIIESGLDIPNANSILVNNAGYYGLAQLYQLRGRVGRGAHQAFAYFLYQKDTQLSELAEKRLRAIFEATELGAGFRIAMKDLEIRGAGSILGAEQSGNVSAVGFDLYTRLLSEAVAQLQGERGREPEHAAPSVALELPIDAYIPDEYISDTPLKMHFYQRLAQLDRAEQVEALTVELTDRFGALPVPVAQLLALVRLKAHAAALGIEAILLRQDEVVFKVRRGTQVDRVALVRRFHTAARVHLGEVRIPRGRFSAEQAQWLVELDALLPVLVGAREQAPPAPSSDRAGPPRAASSGSRHAARP